MLNKVKANVLMFDAASQSVHNNEERKNYVERNELISNAEDVMDFILSTTPYGQKLSETTNVTFPSLGVVSVWDCNMHFEPDWQAIGLEIFNETRKAVRALKMDGHPVTLSPKSFKGKARMISKLFGLETVVIKAVIINSGRLLVKTADFDSLPGRYVQIRELEEGVFEYIAVEYHN